MAQASQLSQICALANLQRAVRFVRHDKDDEVVVDALRDLPYLSWLSSKLPDLRGRLLQRRYQPQNAVIFEQVKGSFTTRPISHIYIEDWIVAQAVANVVGPILDDRIPGNSFAFRLNPRRHEGSKHKFFRAWYRDWPKFIRQIREAVSDELPCLLVTDIAGYFENIDLDLLREMMVEAGVQREVAALVFSQLESWTWRSGYSRRRDEGLLQGNDVSALYANFYLFDVDKHFEEQGVVYHRFMDDFNIHARDQAEAKRLLMELNRLLRSKGLTLNAAKTKILSGKGEINHHFGFHLMDRVEHVLRSAAQADTEATQAERLAILQELGDGARANAHIFKRLLTAFLRARDDAVYPRALQWLTDQPAVTTKLCQYLRSMKDGNKVAADLLDFLADSDRNLYPSQEQEILDVLGFIHITSQQLRGRLVAHAWQRATTRDLDPYSRSLYALLLYKYAPRPELEKLSDLYLRGREDSHVLKKYVALSVTRLNDQDKLTKVIDRLKREPNPDLTDLGVLLGEMLGRVSTADLFRFVAQPTEVRFGKERVYHLDTRRLMLLNVLRLNRDADNVTRLEARVRGFKNRVSCPRSVELLDELLTRL